MTFSSRTFQRSPSSASQVNCEITSKSSGFSGFDNLLSTVLQHVECHIPACPNIYLDVVMVATLILDLFFVLFDKGTDMAWRLPQFVQSEFGIHPAPGLWRLCQVVISSPPSQSVFLWSVRSDFSEMKFEI
jgi:hypothetical protein